jgi:hypothetical protein
MQITHAEFSVTHRKEKFNVLMTVQDTDKNKRRAIVTVNEANTGKTILHESKAGRQLICAFNAKEAVRSAIKERTQ